MLFPNITLARPCFGPGEVGVTLKRLKRGDREKPDRLSSPIDRANIAWSLITG
jgi:hypothetical protein